MATALLLLAGACCNKQETAKVEGHYAYEHAFDYDLYGNHLEVHETGTMDFFADSSALDSARQVYTVVSPEGDTSTIVFDYVSPSRWHLDGDTFYFAGVKESFRMEAVDGDGRESELAGQIVAVIGGSVDYEYRFHLDTLTTERLQWSFTYRDGHSDTWVFVRE